jgi:hypothetical protein
VQDNLKEIQKGNAGENMQNTEEYRKLVNKIDNIFKNNEGAEEEPVFVETTFEFPIAMILVSASVFTMGILVLYFYMMRREQRKLDNDTFTFSLDDEKNNYSKKVKFLDQQDFQVSKI